LLLPSIADMYPVAAHLSVPSLGTQVTQTYAQSTPAYHTMRSHQPHEFPNSSCSRVCDCCKQRLGMSRTCLPTTLPSDRCPASAGLQVEQSCAASLRCPAAVYRPTCIHTKPTTALPPSLSAGQLRSGYLNLAGQQESAARDLRCKQRKHHSTQINTPRQHTGRGNPCVHS
jgi:hypothetical protein